jgi:hypothetical protein
VKHRTEGLAVLAGVALGLAIVVVFLQLRGAAPSPTTAAASPSRGPTVVATAPIAPLPRTDGPSPAPTATALPTVTLVGAGDIASCGSDGDSVTAKLLEGIEGTVFTLGDDAYDNGTAREFRDCYGPTWGRDSIKSRTRPVPGNHEYRSSNAGPYFDYFGAAAGERDKGYYAYDLGAWRIYVLNTNTGTCSAVACDKGSAQERWLQADLAANPHACVLAMWHHPRFSSSRHGNNTVSAALWQDLVGAGAEIILNGHDHTYERFAPMDASGARDDSAGIVEMVVGTGGKDHYEFARVQPNSLVRNASAWGVLELTLAPGSWSFQFVPEPGASFSDSGTGTCH